MNLNPTFTIEEAAVLTSFLESRIRDYEGEEGSLSLQSIMACKGCQRMEAANGFVGRPDDDKNLCTAHADYRWMVNRAKRARDKMLDNQEKNDGT